MVRCYDCTKEKEELTEVIEGTTVKVIRKVCFICKRKRELAEQNEGNWKSGRKAWAY